MKKPKLLVTPTKLEDIVPLVEAGADAFVIGEQRYGLRLAGEFKQESLADAVDIIHQHGKKVYVAVNALFHNDLLPMLREYLLFLQELDVDAVIFGDPAVLMFAREVAPKLALHWNAETTATNYFTCNYWGERGARRAILARELNLDAVLEAKENAKVEIEVQVQGMTCMFQSKRKLIDNYFNFQGKDLVKVGSEQWTYLYDPERDNQYPIFQDVSGTHIMSPSDICMIDELPDLVNAGIDALKVDGVLKDRQYLVAVTKLYRTAIDLLLMDVDQYHLAKADLYKQVEALQPSGRPLDTGFYFKETVY